MTFCAECRDFAQLVAYHRLAGFLLPILQCPLFEPNLYAMNVVCRGQVSVRMATALGSRLGGSRPLTGLGFFACRLKRIPVVSQPQCTRCFQHLANQPPKPEAPAKGAVLAKDVVSAKKQDLGDDGVHISQADQRRKDWNIIKRLAKHIWPKNDWSTRGRVIAGLGLLISAKVLPIRYSNVLTNVTTPHQLLNVQVPILFKSIIDSLNVELTAGSTVWIVAGSLILGCRCFYLKCKFSR